MKTIACLLLLLIATTSFAEFGEPYPADWIGFVVDVDSSVREWACFNTAAPFQEVTLHLVIANPSAGGVSSWHTGMFSVAGGILPSVTFPAGADLTPDDSWDVIIGTGEAALLPNAAGLIHIADLTFFVASPVDVVQVAILPSTFPVGLPFSYTGPDDAETRIPLTIGYPWGWDIYQLNVLCYPDIPNEAATWSAVKALYQ